MSGYTIPGGLVYVGIPPRGQGYGRSFAHLLDPNLPVRSNQPDISGASMPYWPHFGDLTPAARAAHLLWHASGRRDPRFGIGHVFLFFYGLEYRIFVEDGRTDQEAIIREVKALLECYGDNNSFRSYATTFLAATTLAAGQVPILPAVADMTAGYGLTPDFRVGLANRLNQGPLTAEWLLAWYLQHPEKSLRTPATRCFDEFKRLFIAKFPSAHPNGLAVRKSTRPLKVEYRAASAAFTVNLAERFPGLSDPEAVTAPIKAAAAIADACTEALDAYSRHMGRNPQSADSIAATVLLPAEIRNDRLAPAALAFRAWLSEHLGKSVAQVGLDELLRQASLDSDRRVSTSTGIRLSEALALCNVGMEPDPRYGGRLPPGSLVTIFTAPGGGAVDPLRTEYAAARVLIEVAVLAASIDGNDERTGLRSVLNELERLPNISPSERLRLFAYVLHLSRLRAAKPSGWQRLATRPLAERERIAHVALCALTADGRIEAPEIKFAEKLYKALGIPAQRLYNDIHKQTSDEPQTVRPAERRVSGTRIPPRPQKPPQLASPTNNTTVDIPEVTPSRSAPRMAEKPKELLPQPAETLIVDQHVLARTRQDTAEVRGLLDQLYSAADDADAVSKKSTTTPATETPPRYPGLDRSHGQLIDLLVGSGGSIRRSAFELEVTKLRLITDGALVAINEWSYDNFNEPLVEDGDPLVVQPHLLECLRDMVLAT